MFMGVIVIVIVLHCIGLTFSVPSFVSTGVLFPCCPIEEKTCTSICLNESSFGSTIFGIFALS